MYGIVWVYSSTFTINSSHPCRQIDQSHGASRSGSWFVIIPKYIYIYMGRISSPKDSNKQPGTLFFHCSVLFVRLFGSFLSSLTSSFSVSETLLMTWRYRWLARKKCWEIFLGGKKAKRSGKREIHTYIFDRKYICIHMMYENKCRYKHI